MRARLIPPFRISLLRSLARSALAAFGVLFAFVFRVNALLPSPALAFLCGACGLRLRGCGAWAALVSLSPASRSRCLALGSRFRLSGSLSRLCSKSLGLRAARVQRARDARCAAFGVRIRRRALVPSAAPCAAAARSCACLPQVCTGAFRLAACVQLAARCQQQLAPLLAGC